MLVLILVLAGIVVLSAVVGQGAVRLGGGVGWRPWAPAVGFCTLVALGGQIVWLPGRGLGVAALAVLAAFAALGSRDVRRALREGARSAPLAVATGAAACLPFIANGGVGVLGPGVSDDMSAHLLTSFWLRTNTGAFPVGAIGGDLVHAGYPVGAHGLVAALGAATGVGEVAGFAALIVAVPVLTALAALTWLGGSRFGWFPAVLVGLPYLAAAYLAQGSFKETIEALVLLATAAVLDDLMRAGRAPGFRRGLPLALLVAGAGYAYSFPGVLWPVGAVLVLVAASLAARQSVRPLGRPLLGALVLGAAAIGPAVSRMIDFGGSSYAESHKANSGNLFHALSPVEALGVWPVGDFRLTASPRWLVVALAALAGAALIGGLGWWWRGRRLAAPAALVAGIVLWAELALTRNVYAAAKGLAVLAPIAALCIAAPLLASWRRPRRLALRAVSLALLGAAAACSFLVLRDASVGLGAHAKEAESLRGLVRGQRVFFLGVDHFAQWELRGAHLYSAGVLYAPHRLGVHPQKPDGSPNDADNFGSHDLDKVDWVLTPNGAYRSTLPANFRRARSTRSYILYHRIGPTPLREPIEPPGEPGAVLDCTSPPGKALASRRLLAAVLPAPVEVSGPMIWQGQPATPGASATLMLTLPRGRWDASLEYASRLDLRVRAPGLDTLLPGQIGSISPFWSAGTLTSTGRRLALHVTAQRRGSAARLLGASPPALGRAAAGQTVGRIAFTRHGARPVLTPIRSACGRWIDWYAPGGGG